MRRQRRTPSLLNRADFIPDVIWTRADGQSVPVDRANDPRRWSGLVDADDAVITQLYDCKVTTSLDRKPDRIATKMGRHHAQEAQ